MRRTVWVFLFLIAACATEQERAPAPSTTDPATTTTQHPAPASTTTLATPTTTPPAPTTTTTLAPLQGLAYEEVATVDFPIHLVGWADRTSLLATKDGHVLLIEPDWEIRPTPVLDISAQVRNEGERGLLAIAPHEDSTRLFVHYSDNNGDTVVSEFTWVDGSFVDERVVFTIEQPAGNHNGGMIQFGPDGRLYLGLGDGGRSNDAFGHGQNTDTLFAGLTAIDVETGEAELFQYGLRNPWRFWIDQAGGDIVYIADVGQNAFEEVSAAPLTAGVNYGWSITEGLHCFNPSSDCDTDGLTLPVIEVAHGDSGTCSITGGIVYRGAAIPEIVGHYFYSDYCGGYLRSFTVTDGVAGDISDWTDQVGAPGRVTSFGTDFSGEMYVLTTEQVLRVTAVRG
ncbi:MAG TPA: PQQ-dependent sugar dehydrogenase [Acidimicrobiia bacterium]|nr:PQQ-dependent sugar dehydrogenase [Acidimicrobiia bacterium]